MGPRETREGTISASSAASTFPPSSLPSHAGAHSGPSGLGSPHVQGEESRFSKWEDTWKKPWGIQNRHKGHREQQHHKGWSVQRLCGVQGHCLNGAEFIQKRNGRLGEEIEDSDTAAPWRQWPAQTLTRCLGAEIKKIEKRSLFVFISF